MIEIKEISATVSDTVDLPEVRMKKLYVQLVGVTCVGTVANDLESRIKIKSDKYGELVDVRIGSKILRDTNNYMNGRLPMLGTPNQANVVIDGMVVVNFDTDEQDNSLHIYDKTQFSFDYDKGNATAGTVKFFYGYTESEMRYIPFMKELNMIAGTGKQEKTLDEKYVSRLALLPTNYTKLVIITKNEKPIISTTLLNEMIASQIDNKVEVNLKEDIDTQMEDFETIFIDTIPAKHLISETSNSTIKVTAYNGTDSESIEMLEFGLIPISAIL